MEKKERELRSKLMKKYKSMQEMQLKGQQEKLRQTVEGKLKLGLSWNWDFALMHIK